MNTILIGVAGDMQEISAEGRAFSWDYEGDLYREDRAASSLLRRDWKDQKRIFNFSYEICNAATRKRIQQLFLLKTKLSLSVQDGVDFIECDVYMSPPSLGTRILVGDSGLWENVSFELREA